MSAAVYHKKLARVLERFAWPAVAAATAPDGSEVVVWRWYDAVVLGEEAGLIRLWEPAHGEVVARRRRAQQQRPRPPPGTAREQAC